MARLIPAMSKEGLTLANKVPDIDKGAVQKLDYNGKRIDKGAVEAHEPIGDERYITAIIASGNTFNVASELVSNIPITRNVTAFS